MDELINRFEDNLSVKSNLERFFEDPKTIEYAKKRYSVMLNQIQIWNGYEHILCAIKDFMANPSEQKIMDIDNLILNDVINNN